MVEPIQLPGDAAYQGLSYKARITVLAIGAFIALVNLCVAWYISHDALQALRLSNSDMEPFTAWIDKGGAQLGPEARHDLAARAMHIVTLTKLISNKQGLVLVCFGGAFALAAVGFALFIIGADGAFRCPPPPARRPPWSSRARRRACCASRWPAG